MIEQTKPRLRLIVCDGSAPWVRSLFLAMPADVEVVFLDVVSLGRGLSPVLSALRRKSPSAPHVVIPGWTRAFDLSSRLVRRALVRLVEGETTLTRIVYNLPQYAAVAEGMRGLVPQAYYAYDPYTFYDWDVGRIRALEDRALACCDPILGISRRLQADFAERAGREALHCPNAVSSAFLRALAAAPRLPPDLRGIPGPLVGCVGQMNDTYDWGLLQALTERLPEITFVFVGPIIDEDAAARARIKAFMQGRNVLWVGPKPHDALPAYMNAFDVCLNPLLVSPRNDRRSPLRLYDYLATDKPVLSTPLAEVAALDGHVTTADTPAAMASLLRRMVEDPAPFVGPRRAEWIAANTWEHRARQLRALLDPNEAAAPVAIRQEVSA